ncbi:MAG: hypothetical protein ACTSQJ_09640 [Promethearchaeota archaeon]
MTKEKISTSEQFLKKLIESQKPLPKQLNNLETLKQRIKEVIKKNINIDLSFYFGGSLKRETMLKEIFDLNVVVYSKENTVKSVKEFHAEIGKAIKKKYKKINEKNIGWELLYKEGFHIDVIPGVLINRENGKSRFYNTNTEKQLETSIELHDHYIQNSERSNVIQLMKLWKLRRRVPINSFLLELITLLGCRGINRTQLEKQVIKVFNYIRNNIENIKIKDPANQNNDLSDLITREDKTRIKELAQEALYAKTWNKIFKR